MNTASQQMRAYIAIVTADRRQRVLRPLVEEFFSKLAAACNDPGICSQYRFVSCGFTTPEAATQDLRNEECCKGVVLFMSHTHEETAKEIAKSGLRTVLLVGEEASRAFENLKPAEKEKIPSALCLVWRGETFCARWLAGILAE